LYGNNIHSSDKIFDLQVQWWGKAKLDAYFTLSRNISSHSNKYWCFENAHAVCEVPLHDKSALNVHKIMWTMSFEEINSDHYVKFSLTLLF